MIECLPNPGSDDADSKGCTCPRMDNAYGKGACGGGMTDGAGDTLFVIDADCRLHGTKRNN